MVDCELLSKVYINLLDQKEPKLDFLVSSDIDKSQEFNKKINFSKKIIIPNSDEIKKHKDFLKKDLKKNFY